MWSRSAIGTVLKKRYAVMGIVNVTPDSFYDGGRFSDTEAAVERGIRLGEEGADILDIGGASSRPVASPVTPEEEAKRVIPVIRRLSKKFQGPLSVDTTWSSVARQALNAGATLINDISAGRCDPEMARLAAESGCAIVLMHSRGTPQTMQAKVHYSNVVADVKKELRASIKRFIAAGVSPERIIVDPGIGFAKTEAQNIALLRGLESFVKMGYPVLVGASRKSFIGAITGKGVEERLYGSLSCVASSFLRGARIFRVHDAAATKDFCRVFSEIETGAEKANG
jgi:dihydropteroate synthase